MTEARTVLFQVQRDLLEGKPLADILRKCILVGSQSGSAELRAWATRELKGYDDTKSLPEYRKVPAAIRADAIVGNGQITGQAMGLSMLPEWAREHITNQVPLFSGIGELESLLEGAQTSNQSPHLSLPGWELIAAAMDKESGNPFQHIHALYWVISPSAIAGVLDAVRTALTEILAELGGVMVSDEATPTAEQVTQALHVAVSGGSPQFNIAAPVTSASGDSAIEGVQTGAAGRDVEQSYNLSHNQAILDWLGKYRAALPELDASLRPVAEHQIEQVTAEIAKPEPQEVVVKGLLGSLKSFATNAIASAGAGAGTMGLAEVVAHWPF